MKKIFSFFAALFLAVLIAPCAQAATMSVDFTVLPGNIALSGAGWTETGSVDVYHNDVTNQHVLPISTSTDGTYLGILANSSATYTFTQPVKGFAFNWGTVDNYNKVEVTLADNSSYLVEGQTVIDLATAQKPTFDDGRDNVYFTLLDDLGIKSIKFIDVGTNAFEISDLRAVPLPAALGLFGAALFGLGVRRRFAV